MTGMSCPLYAPGVPVGVRRACNGGMLISCMVNLTATAAPWTMATSWEFFSVTVTWQGFNATSGLGVQETVALIEEPLIVWGGK